MVVVSSRRDKRAVQKPPREVLRDLRKRAGYGAAELSRALGYASTNGYVQYEYAQQGDKLIPAPLITKLIPLMRGRGTPPVTADELIAISEARSISAPAPVQNIAQILGGLDDIPSYRHPLNSALLPILYKVERGVFMEASQVGQKRYGVGPIAPAPDVDVNGQFCVVMAGGPRMEALHCVRPDQIGVEARKGRRCVCTKERDKTGLVEVIVSRIGQNGEPESGVLIGVVIGAYVRE